MRAPACRVFFICAASAANSISSCGISHNSFRSVGQCWLQLWSSSLLRLCGFAYDDRGIRYLKNQDDLGGGGWRRRSLRSRWRASSSRLGDEQELAGSSALGPNETGAQHVEVALDRSRLRERRRLTRFKLSLGWGVLQWWLLRSWP